jgi:hypothetical protein
MSVSMLLLGVAYRVLMLDVDLGFVAGEREAIQLAAEVHANQLIIDDLQGREEAQRRGLRVTGTVGVLREAAVLGLLDLPRALKRLQLTNFYLAPEVLARILKDIP